MSVILVKMVKAKTLSVTDTRNEHASGFLQKLVSDFLQDF